MPLQPRPHNPFRDPTVLHFPQFERAFASSPSIDTLARERPVEFSPLRASAAARSPILREAAATGSPIYPASTAFQAQQQRSAARHRSVAKQLDFSASPRDPHVCRSAAAAAGWHALRPSRLSDPSMSIRARSRPPVRSADAPALADAPRGAAEQAAGAAAADAAAAIRHAAVQTEVQPAAEAARPETGASAALSRVDPPAATSASAGIFRARKLDVLQEEVLGATKPMARGATATAHLPSSQPAAAPPGLMRGAAAPAATAAAAPAAAAPAAPPVSSGAPTQKATAAYAEREVKPPSVLLNDKAQQALRRSISQPPSYPFTQYLEQLRRRWNPTPLPARAPDWERVPLPTMDRSTHPWPALGQVSPPRMPYAPRTAWAPQAADVLPKQPQPQPPLGMPSMQAGWSMAPQQPCFPAASYQWVPAMVLAVVPQLPAALGGWSPVGMLGSPQPPLVYC